MDKIATNNLIVDLRTDVKAAKSMVAGNLVRKINELKKALEKDDDPVKKEKAEKKIETLHGDIKLLKTIDPYSICKDAILKPDTKHWNDLMGDSKASDETRLKARIISKGRIQKKVASFRSDHKDCDEWLEEYFEFREKKRELTEVKVTKRKSKQSGHNNKPPRERRDKPDAREPDENPRKAKQFNRRGGDRRQGGPPANSKTNFRNHNRDQNRDRDQNNFKPKQADSLHPSWASKRKEKEILKAALAGKAPVQPKRIVLNSA